MLLANEQWARAPWEVLAVGLWLALMFAFPFLNADRLRLGDLVGGTVVIAVPKKVLLKDLAEDRPEYAFTQDQLSYYGILELQVLEEVLRRPEGRESWRLRREIAIKICRRIGWPAPVPEQKIDGFLRSFYVAQRAHLERKKHMGYERAVKAQVPPPPPPRR